VAKVSFSFISESAWVSGIKRGLLLGLISLLASHCRHSPSSTDATSEFANQQADDDRFMFQDGVDDLGKKRPVLIKHPANNSRSVLKRLVMDSQLPSQQDLAQCQDEIRLLAKNTLNDRDLINHQQELVQAAGQARQLYHWCFYQSLDELYHQLEMDAMDQTYKAQVEQFHRDMKALWILAISLDQLFKKSQYFPYLRQAYIKLSQRLFARDLETISDPLGNPQLQPKPQKPAGKVTE
jgi:hypothetical protein